LLQMKLPMIPADLSDSAPVFNASSDRILIFSEQKTGTNTLQDTLGQVTLDHKRLPQWEAGDFPDVYPENVKTHSSGIARDWLKKVPPEKNVWVFKSVRNTYSRALSYFFQSVCDYGKNETCKAGLTADNLDDSVMKRMVADFDEWVQTEYVRRLQGNGGDATPSVFGDVTGVDVIQNDFDFKERRMLLQTQRGESKLYVVLLRLEDADQWETILQPLLPEYQAGGVNGGGTNLAGEKWYADVYNQFEKIYRFSGETVSMLKEADMNNHFYSRSELATFEAHAKGRQIRDWWKVWKVW